jgi:rhodanese-related sulfurtransferase
MPHGPRFEKLAQEAKARIEEVTVAEAVERQAAGALLIDVREADEFSQGHAPDALHLSKGMLEVKIEQQVPDPNAAIVCYCGGGNRSALAADSLQTMGYTNVSSMIGGFSAWKKAGLPIEGAP